MGLSPERLRMLELAALMHDVGKIGLPDAILNKREGLTSDEWREVRQHTIRGQHILGSTELDEILPWVRGHHERWDGQGYPDGLSGIVIPFEARLLCACDAFDAMTSERAYRAAMSTTAAMRELESGAGSQFDPQIASELFALVAEEQETEASGESSDARGQGSRVLKWSPSGEFAAENS
jgi:HD-GYP domain-containing protein (c-di-GMP phosphodiesterase class II)